jgi:L-seryl-tRNA(Ser) seleniumtransferase
MIDVAADVPPVENLWKYNDMGFDLVCISGGKAICGPQSAGILMGKKDLIAAARLSGPPRGNNIGRGMKINKEEILGMYVALESYISRDHEKDWKIWEDRIAHIDKAIKNIQGVKTEISVPPIANHSPLLTVTWDPSKIKISGGDLAENMRKGTPSIEPLLGRIPNTIRITVFVLKHGQEKIVAARLKEELIKVSV